ncbi:MAG: Zn-ribbon domain-containing OB-fold protein [Gammaproteobacteria bacterium]
MSARHDELPDKPRPEPPPEHCPYWDALTEHRLVVQRCAECGRLRHYPRPLCDACYSFEHEWVELDRRGTIASWAVSHHPFHPAFKRDVPYVSLTVDMIDGVRMHGRLVDARADELAVGKTVVLDFDDVDDALTLPVFRLAEPP